VVCVGVVGFTPAVNGGILSSKRDRDLQGYADGFVDVSDSQHLPLPIARTALQKGVRLVGEDERSPPTVSR
jgi:hypothetical protein